MIGRILMYLIPALLIADIYIYMLFIRKISQNLIGGILWFLPTVLLLIGAYLFFVSRSISDYRDIFIFIFIAIVLPKLLFFVISLLDLPLRYFFTWKVYPFSVLGAITGLAVIFIVIYGCTYGKERFQVKQIEFSSPHLPPAFDGYKVLQVSDIHIGNWKSNTSAIEKLVNIINEQQVDAIMVTGDLVHNSASELDGYESILSRINAPDGVYSILGNHDYGLYRNWKGADERRANLEDLKKRQASMGWKMLNNEHIFLHKGNDSIALIGVENQGKPPFPEYGDLPKAMRGTEKTSFKLLLSHDPSHWRREVLSTDIDLMLAGHTHATQFAIGKLSFASLVYDEWSGLYKEDNQGLYVNVGIGYVMLPFRFGAWPEITIITLKREK
ncbi:MAG: metallophosphoesterase [Prevotella sp.]|jgi:predicted MPP superfamily phosphohydrolase|nr:metallophosphoesterase [Prevotella sp.]